MKLDALFSCSGGDWYGFHKKQVGTHYVKLVFLHPVGSMGHIVRSGVSRVRNIDPLFFILSGPGAVSIKSKLGQVMQNLWFWIRWDLGGPHTAFRWVWSGKRRCPIFYAQVALVQVP
jgi:hypothetical protein